MIFDRPSNARSQGFCVPTAHSPKESLQRGLRFGAARWRELIDWPVRQYDCRIRSRGDGLAGRGQGVGQLLVCRAELRQLPGCLAEFTDSTAQFQKFSALLLGKGRRLALGNQNREALVFGRQLRQLLRLSAQHFVPFALLAEGVTMEQAGEGHPGRNQRENDRESLGTSHWAGRTMIRSFS